ncbi:hypothetical protein D9613_009757 [Agrocybe pediades]|uniref:Uncharacterized protein n=1 Tax=Agrocybe pediades TaxID=84607 RepID=A0A8H4QX17_9AGAR|nr:hypothetical protein D9613_009757 [Agrocybe pediades]
MSIITMCMCHQPPVVFTFIEKEKHANSIVEVRGAVQLKSTSFLYGPNTNAQIVVPSKPLTIRCLHSTATNPVQLFIIHVWYL